MGAIENIVLYFPDTINLRAFILVEQPRDANYDYRASTLVARLDPQQLDKAQNMYGAKLRQAH